MQEQERLTAEQVAELDRRHRDRMLEIDAAVKGCLSWARESIASYLRWSKEGRVRHAGPGRAEGVTALGVEEIVQSHYGLERDLDHRNYIEVGNWLGEYLRDYPQDEQLHEVLVWARYYHKPLGDCLVKAPFSRVPMRMSSIGQVVVSGADEAMKRFDMFVARKKAEQKILAEQEKAQRGLQRPA